MVNDCFVCAKPSDEQLVKLTELAALLEASPTSGQYKNWCAKNTREYALADELSDAQVIEVDMYDDGLETDGMEIVQWPDEYHNR